MIITLSMAIQVRAEVAERLDGVVSSVEDLRSQLEGALARVRQLMPLGMTMIPCLAAKLGLCKYCKNLKMPLHFSWLIHFSHFSRLASWRERAKGTERG